MANYNYINDLDDEMIDLDNNQNADNEQNKSKGFINWCKRHKKALILGGITVTVTAVGIYIYKKNKSSKTLLKAFDFKDAPDIPSEFSEGELLCKAVPLDEWNNSHKDYSGKYPSVVAPNCKVNNDFTVNVPKAPYWARNGLIGVNMAADLSGGADVAMAASMDLMSELLEKVVDLDLEDVQGLTLLAELK